MLKEHKLRYLMTMRKQISKLNSKALNKDLFIF